MVSAYDYGRENGLWVNDGISYVVKCERNNKYHSSSRKSKSKNLNYSERLALNYGFEIVYDEGAYNGRYFIKGGKKWIHNIDALKKQLRKKSDYDLEELGYDVEIYYTSH